MTEENASPSLNTAPEQTSSAPAAPSMEGAAVAAPAVQAAPAPDVSAETKKAETVLGTSPAPEVPKEPPKDPAPPAEGDTPAAAPVEPKKEEGSQSAEPAPLPAYENFTLPEDIKLDDAKLGEFTKDLGEFERDSGIDHAKAQAFGQKLLDRYVAETQENNKRLIEHFTNSWEKQKNDWKTAFENDPDIGGNRKETTVNDALQAIARGGDETQQKEFRDVMEATGIGNHPAVIRHLANLNRIIAKYETETATPLAGTKPALPAQSKVQKRYGTF